MLVDAKKLKQLRMSRNWTQQHLADVCGVSMRTIQRVEKDGVASNETIGAYAAIFEIDVQTLLISKQQFENRPQNNRVPALLVLLLFAAGFMSGVGATLWLF